MKILSKYLLIVLLSIANMQVFDGITLFTPYNSNFQEETVTYLIDNDREIINTWTHNTMPASMAYLLQDSTIIFPFRVENPTMIAGGVGGGVQKISWDGNIIWEYIFSDELYQQHHDVEPLPNGNVLILVWEKKTEEEAYALGRETIENDLGVMWSLAILELNPITGNIDWEWHLWDHLIQDVDENLSNYGIISEHPELFDINCGSAGANAGGPQPDNGDWMHVNSVHYNEILDQIVLSSRTQNELYIIDHSTTTLEAASHEGGNSGKGGDILYRWGNPGNYGRGDAADIILGSQHSINWIPAGYPGEGNLILFNNFHSNNSSAVIEINPPIDSDGNYIINDTDPFGPETWDWIYTCDIVVPMQGGSFRLPNGNTIVGFTQQAKILEVDVLGNTVWEYEHEVPGLPGEFGNFWIARSQKYDINYLDSSTTGDINNDGIVNVLDIVALVNIILSNEFDDQADLNQDGIVNVLDIVLMVGVILNEMS